MENMAQHAAAVDRKVAKQKLKAVTEWLI